MSVKFVKESKLRSFLKAMSWRLIATTTTFLLALFVFQDHEDAVTKSSLVAGMELGLKLILYYLHERGWQMLPRGSLRKIIKEKFSFVGGNAGNDNL